MSRTAHHTAYAHRAGNCAHHECARTSITIPKPWWASGLGPSAACDFAVPTTPSPTFGTPPP